MNTRPAFFGHVCRSTLRRASSSCSSASDGKYHDFASHTICLSSPHARLGVTQRPLAVCEMHITQRGACAHFAFTTSDGKAEAIQKTQRKHRRNNLRNWCDQTFLTGYLQKDIFAWLAPAPFTTLISWRVSVITSSILFATSTSTLHFHDAVETALRGTPSRPAAQGGRRSVSVCVRKLLTDSTDTGAGRDS